MSEVLEPKAPQTPAADLGIVSESGEEIAERTSPRREEAHETNEPDEPPEPIETTEDKAEEPADKSKKKAPKPDETPAWMKREIAIEREKRRELEARLEALTKGKTEDIRPERNRDVEPNPEEYVGGAFDPQYLRDVADYSGRRAVMDWQQQQIKNDQDRMVAQREAAIVESFPDYYQVIEPLGESMKYMHPDVADVFTTSEVGPAMAYLLGQNEAAIEELLSLPPAKALMALGKIEARILEQANSKRKDSGVPEQKRESEPVKVPTPWRAIGGPSGSTAYEKAVDRLESDGNADEFISEFRRSRKK